MTRRRDLLLGTAAVTSAALVSRLVSAQAKYPERAVRLVIPFAPGGVNDAIGRPWADRMKPLLGTVVVENQGGGGGSLGAASVARAAPDGYTILLGGGGSLIITPIAAQRPPYDPIKDFEPISILAVTGLVIAVHPALPVSTLKELIAYAMANPGKLSYGSAGTGSFNHLTGELLKSISGGPDIVHVPYKGAGPAVADTVAGQIQSTFTTPATAAGHLKAGRLRALAVTADRRLPDYADVPTFVESGVRNLVIQHWWGILAPAGLPKSVMQRLETSIRETLASKEVQERFRAVGVADPPRTGPEPLRAPIAADLARWSAIVASAGIKAD